MMAGGKITIFRRDVNTEVVSLQCMNSQCGIGGLKNMKLRGKSSEDIVKESEEREWCLDLIKTHCIHYGIFNNNYKKNINSYNCL